MNTKTLKQVFFNKYSLLINLFLLTILVFYYSINRFSYLLNPNTDRSEKEIELAQKEQKELLDKYRLVRDPDTLSYTDIILEKDKDFSNVEELKVKDTDEDGLSDYDEIYIYRTSAFLEDTDGDGISDKDEIQNGTDALCPKGKVCGGFDLGKEEKIKKKIVESLENKTSNENIVPEMNFYDIDIDYLKESLLENGLSQEDIQKMTDDEIRNLYKTAYQQYQESQKTNIKKEDNIKTIDENNLDKLSASEIRALLLKMGMNKEKLDAVNDNDLLNLYKNLLKNLKENNSNNN